MAMRAAHVRKGATLRDVAKAAGVSPATASRVLSSDYPVAEATRRRVLDAVQRVGYVPPRVSQAASAPRMVAMVVRDVASPLVSRIARGVEEEASLRGRHCLIATTHGDPARELDVVQTICDHHLIDAIILVGGVVPLPEHEERMRRYTDVLAASGARLVFCGRELTDPKLPALVANYDNAAGAHSITSFLLSRGHRRIAVITGIPDHTATVGRFEGYRQALEDFGVPLDDSLIVRGSQERDAGYAGVCGLIERGTDFTAVFAHNDLVAAGVMAGLRDAGLRVPDDVSVVGFDDIDLAQELTPRLTTVHVPHEELGRAAVRLAVEKPDPRSSAAEVILGTHVVVRDSVRAAKPAALP